MSLRTRLLVFILPLAVIPILILGLTYLFVLRPSVDEMESIQARFEELDSVAADSHREVGE